MNAPPTPEPPVDPRKLDVTQPAAGSLVRLLAWMLVLVLVSFVGVSVWFLYRVQEIRQRYEVDDVAPNVRRGGGLSIDPAEVDPTQNNHLALALYAHAESLEAAQHALDQGNLDQAAKSLVFGEEATGWEAAYLRAQTQRCLMDLPCEAILGDGSLAGFPEGNLLAAAAGAWSAPSSDEPTATSEDGRLVALAYDAEVHLWDVVEGRRRHVLRADRSFSEPFAFSRDGRRILTAWCERVGMTDDGVLVIAGCLKVWDTATGRLLFHIKAHAGAVRKVALDQDGSRALSVGEDGRVKVWDLAPRERLLTFDNVRPLGMTFEPDGATLTTLGADGKVRRRHAWTGKRMPDVALAGFDAKTSDAILHADGGLVAAGGADRKVRLWDARSGKLLHTLAPANSQPLGPLAFSPDGKLLACASGKGVHVWRVADGGLHKVRAAEEIVIGLAFFGDNLLFASDAAGGPSEWNLLLGGERPLRWETSTPVRRLLFLGQDKERMPLLIGERTMELFASPSEKHPRVYLRRTLDPIRDATLSPDDSRLVAVCDGGQLLVWDAKTGIPLAAFKTASSPARLAFSHDGQCLAVAAADGSVRLLDSALPADPVAVHGPDRPITALERTGRGALVVAHQGGAWGEWDAVTGRTLARYDPVGGEILDIRSTNDEAYLLFRTKRGQVRLQQGKDEPNHLILNEPGLAVFSRCGKYVACVRDNSREVRIRDARTDESCGSHVVPGQGRITALALCAGGNYLAVAQGRTVWAFERDIGNLGGTSFDSDVTALGFDAREDAEKAQLALGTRGGRAWLWSIAKEKKADPVPLPSAANSPVRTLALSATGKHLAAGDEAGNVFAWETATRRRVRTYRHAGPISALAFDGGTSLAVGGRDGVTWLHDLRRR